MAIAGSQGKKRVLSLWILLRLDLLEQIVLSMWTLFSLVDSTGEIAWYLFIFQGIQTLAVSPPPPFFLSQQSVDCWLLLGGIYEEALGQRQRHTRFWNSSTSHTSAFYSFWPLRSILSHWYVRPSLFFSSLPPHGHLGWFQFGGHSEYDYRITGYCF